MSKPRRWFVTLGLLAVANTASAQSAAPATAADTLALGEALRAAQQQFAEARAEVERAEERARSTPDDSLTPGGATLLFRRRSVSAGDLATLTAAFRGAESLLRRDLGDAGRSLLAESRWRLSVRDVPRRFARPILGFEPVHPGTRSVSLALSPPLDEEYLRGAILREAGARLAQRHPALNRWLAGAFEFREADATHYYAARELAASGSQRAGRCARGVVDECLVILDPTRFADWIVDGEPAMRAPAGPLVRQSVLQFAIERGGATVIATASTAPDSTAPVPLLAQASGMTPQDFIAAWHARIAGATTARNRVAPGLALSAAAWMLLFAIVSTRRRPR